MTSHKNRPWLTAIRMPELDGPSLCAAVRRAIQEFQKRRPDH